MRRPLTVLALIATLIALSAGTASASQRLPRLLAWPCRAAIHCQQAALYRPRTFQPGANYSFETARWTSWGRFGASATVTLLAEFAGKKLTLHEAAVFYDPQRRCGVLTFARWVAPSGDGGRLIESDGTCFFAPGIP